LRASAARIIASVGSTAASVAASTVSVGGGQLVGQRNDLGGELEQRVAQLEVGQVQAADRALELGARGRRVRRRGPVRVIGLVIGHFAIVHRVITRA
jgi:hypothetical protein